MGKLLVVENSFNPDKRIEASLERKLDSDEIYSAGTFEAAFVQLEKRCYTSAVLPLSFPWHLGGPAVLHGIDFAKRCTDFGINPDGVFAYSSSDEELNAARNSGVLLYSRIYKISPNDSNSEDVRINFLVKDVLSYFNRPA